VLSASPSGWVNDVRKYKGAKKIKEGFEYHSHTNEDQLTIPQMKKFLKEVEEHERAIGQL